jgi:hypothetical protein
VAMNRAAADTFQRLGQDPQKIVGKSVWEMFPEMKGTHAPMKFEFLYPGDKRWYEIQGVRHHTRSHPCVSGHHGSEARLIIMRSL